MQIITLTIISNTDIKKPRRRTEIMGVITDNVLNVIEM
jgi:hypothetical protein